MRLVDHVITIWQVYDKAIDRETQIKYNKNSNTITRFIIVLI